MKKSDVLDFSKLLGFDVIVDQISGSIDFQNEAIGAKLGAKVGAAEDSPVAPAEGVDD